MPIIYFISKTIQTTKIVVLSIEYRFTPAKLNY